MSAIQNFYEAALIALQAAQELMLRYAELARRLSQETENEQRQQELERVAEVCEWLSEYPARDFRDALQAVWFLFVLLQIESNASSFSPGTLRPIHAPLSRTGSGTGQIDARRGTDSARTGSGSNLMKSSYYAAVPARAILPDFRSALTSPWGDNGRMAATPPIF